MFTDDELRLFTQLLMERYNGFGVKLANHFIKKNEVAVEQMTKLQDETMKLLIKVQQKRNEETP